MNSRWPAILLVTLFGFTLLFPLQTFNMPRVYASSSGMHWGVNYSSDNWKYNTNDTILERDFLLFQNSGIDIISIMLTWSLIEPHPGVFNTALLDRIVHLCSIADAYGIDVMMDFHTLSSDNSYTIPSWVVPQRLATVVLNPHFQNMWLDYQSYVIDYCSGVKNLHSWQIMNEPLITGHGETQQDFVDLWKEEVAVFHNQSSLPISLRFGCWSFNEYWKNYPEIYDLFDYMSYNWYPNKGEACLKNAVALASAHGLQPVITEYGFASWTDSNQDTSYVNQINLFESIGINFALAWQYGDYKGGSGYNLYNTLEDYVRPAFYRLAKANAVQGVYLLDVIFEKTIIESGYCTDVNVTVLNQYTEPESFKLDLYANSTLFYTRKITIPNDTQVTLNFVCNMTVPYGNYSVNVAVESLPGQPEIAHNQYIYSNVTVTVKGDLNGDFNADLADLVLFAQAYRSKPSDPQWNPNADLNNDGEVSLSDFVIFLAR